MIKKLIAYLICVATTYLIGVALVSQFNLARISELGHQVGMNDRLQTVFHDWLGMLATYLPLIAIALLIALLFTGLLLTRFISRSPVLYVLAGFVALVALHQIMYVVLGLTGIAATRTLFGLLAQGLAGAIGGYVYYRLSNPSVSATAQ